MSCDWLVSATIGGQTISLPMSFRLDLEIRNRTMAVDRQVIKILLKIAPNCTFNSTQLRLLGPRLYCHSKFPRATNHLRNHNPDSRRYSWSQPSEISLPSLRQRHYRPHSSIYVPVPVPDRVSLQLHQHHQVHHRWKRVAVKRIDENYGIAKLHALDCMVHKVHVVPNHHHLGTDRIVQNSVFIAQWFGSLHSFKFYGGLAVLLPLHDGSSDLLVHVLNIL